MKLTDEKKKKAKKEKMKEVKCIANKLNHQINIYTMIYK